MENPTKQPPERPVTFEDIKTLYTFFQRFSATMFNRSGELAPQLFIVPIDGATAEMVRWPANVLAEFFTADSFEEAHLKRKLLGDLIRQMLTPGSDVRTLMVARGQALPHVVAQINEAWMTMRSKDDPHSDIPPSEDPERREVITIMLHTAVGSFGGQLLIEQNPRRAVESSDPPMEVRGGFTFTARGHA